jgi:hypothetical protein
MQYHILTKENYSTSIYAMDGLFFTVLLSHGIDIINVFKKINLFGGGQCECLNKLSISFSNIIPNTPDLKV